MDETFWKQAVKLKNGYSFIYGLTQSWWEFYPKFWIEDERWIGEKYWIEGFPLVYDTFSVPRIIQYADNKILIVSWGWHEGESSEFYYDPEKKKIFDIYEDIVKPSQKELAYPFYSVDISNGNLILKEYAYCCDQVYNHGWNEIFTYDSKTFDLKSQERIAPLKTWIWGKDWKEITLNAIIISEDYGFSVQNSNYKITNPEMIDKHNETSGKQKNGYPTGFSITWKLYKNEYLEILQLAE